MKTKRIDKFLERQKTEEVQGTPGGQEWCTYIDTDSVFYPAKPIIEKEREDVDAQNEEEMTEGILDVAKDVENYLNFSYDKFASDLVFVPEHIDHWFEIKQELIARSGIWVRKKRYAQWIINDEGEPSDKLDVKGLDIVRSDFPTAFRDILEEVIVSILKGKTESEINDIILDFREEIQDHHIDKIARPTSVNNIPDYDTGEFGKRKKGTPAHVMAALNYNDLLEHLGIDDEIPPIQDGEKIKWVYLKKNRLGFEKMGYKGADDPDEVMDFIYEYTDYDKLYKKNLKTKLESIYEAVGWSFPSIEQRQAEQFFGI